MTALLWTLICLLSVVGCGEQSDPDTPEVDDGLTDAEFTRFEAGTYTMGSPDGTPFRNGDEKAHEVTITRPFVVQTTEVTQGQWFRLMEEGLPAFFRGCGESCPVERVNWYEALEYLNRLSASEGREACYELTDCQGTIGGACQDPECVDPTNCEQSTCFGDFVCGGATFKGLDCEGYRLPTEAEWEYAARDGATGNLYAGELSPEFRGCVEPDETLDTIGWYCANATARTQPSGLKRPNTAGLHDVSGNVWEWVWDRYTSDLGTVSVTDPTGGQGESIQRRVVRGGSWASQPQRCRLATRLAEDPSRRAHSIGFRAARTLR